MPGALWGVPTARGRHFLGEVPQAGKPIPAGTLPSPRRGQACPSPRLPPRCSHVRGLPSRRLSPPLTAYSLDGDDGSTVSNAHLSGAQPLPSNSEGAEGLPPAAGSEPGHQPCRSAGRLTPGLSWTAVPAPATAGGGPASARGPRPGCDPHMGLPALVWPVSESPRPATPGQSMDGHGPGARDVGPRRGGGPSPVWGPVLCPPRRPRALLGAQSASAAAGSVWVGAG